MVKITKLLESYLSFRERNSEGTKYTIKNPLILLRQKGVIRLSNGQAIPFNKKNKTDILYFVFFLLENGIFVGRAKTQWKFNERLGIVETPTGIKFNIEKFDAGIMAETFVRDVHFIEGLKNKTVVQAGGFIGDTALYYASLGATIYSFEPNSDYFKVGLQNIELNPNLSPRIKFENLAIGEDGYVNFPLNDRLRGGGSIYNLEKMKTVRVKSASIETVLQEYDIESPFLLDLDIKGAEFTVLKDKSIGKFEKVRIEYSPYILKDSSASLSFLNDRLLEYGFKNIRIFKHSCGRDDLSIHGTLEAFKN